jgi:hypothetical protein
VVGTYIRILIGIAVGLVVGLVFTVFVITAKVGFLVNTPRPTHAFVLFTFFAVPALAGGLVGLLWRRGH